MAYINIPHLHTDLGNFFLWLAFTLKRGDGECITMNMKEREQEDVDTTYQVWDTDRNRALVNIKRRKFRDQVKGCYLPKKDSAR